jgi:hypothetical protein
MSWIRTALSRIRGAFNREQAEQSGEIFRMTIGEG